MFFVQDVLLLADEGQAAGDVDIEGYPDQNFPKYFIDLYASGIGLFYYPRILGGCSVYANIW